MVCCIATLSIVCVHDGSQALARMKQVKSLVDVLELESVSNVLIHLELPLKVAIHQLGHINA